MAGRGNCFVQGAVKLSISGHCGRHRKGGQLNDRRDVSCLEDRFPNFTLTRFLLAVMNCPICMACSLSCSMGYLMQDANKYFMKTSEPLS